MPHWQAAEFSYYSYSIQKVFELLPETIHTLLSIQCIKKFFVNILIQPKFQAMLQT
jgi:hypothetical protein